MDKDYCSKTETYVTISEDGTCSMKQGTGNGKLSNPCPHINTLGCLLAQEKNIIGEGC